MLLLVEGQNGKQTNKKTVTNFQIQTSIIESDTQMPSAASIIYWR